MATINLLPWRETLRKETTTTVSKTMFLGDLPYIGGLFQANRKF